MQNTPRQQSLEGPLSAFDHRRFICLPPHNLTYNLIFPMNIISWKMNESEKTHHQLNCLLSTVTAQRWKMELFHVPLDIPYPRKVRNIVSLFRRWRLNGKIWNFLKFRNIICLYVQGLTLTIRGKRFCRNRLSTSREKWGKTVKNGQMTILTVAAQRCMMEFGDFWQYCCLWHSLSGGTKFVKIRCQFSVKISENSLKTLKWPLFQR